MSVLHNPVLIKELRGRMRGARAFTILTVFLSITTVFMLLLYLAVRSAVNSDPFSAGAVIGKSLFLGVATVALIQVMIIVPAQAAGALASEKERETYDLLIATLLPAWQIVLGKLFAALAYAVLLIVAVVPLMALAFFFGGVTGTEVVIALIGLLATALLYGSVGIALSTIASRTLTATVMSQAVNILVLLGIPFLVFVFFIVIESGIGADPDWITTYPFMYATGWILALHPFIALGATELFLSEGEGTWAVPIDRFNGDGVVWIPHPWLAFVIEAVIVSILLILLAVRYVRRTQRRPPPPPQRPPAA